MRKWVTIGVLGVMAGVIVRNFNSLNVTVSASEKGWHQDAKGWWYENADGTYQADKWFQDWDGSWYHFDASGYMQTGWFQDQKQDWYYFDTISGKMRTGYFRDTNKKDYYFLESGKMATESLKEYNEDGYVYSYYIQENGEVCSAFSYRMDEDYVEESTDMIIVDTRIKDSDVKNGKLRKIVINQEQEYKITSADNFFSSVWSNYGKCVTSNLFPQKDGSFVRVQRASMESDLKDNNRMLIVETYTKDFKKSNYKLIDQELPIFGGVYATDNNYFVISGQENPNESDSCEVIRIIKYDKNWNRIDSASIYGANTIVPFDYGSLKCVDQDGILHIRTSHLMYKSDDGLNHQANMSFQIRISSMEVLYSAYEVAYVPTGYVAHSFDQHITADGNKIIALDQGDAYPRAAVLSRYSAEERSGKGEMVKTISYAGKIGDNVTHAKIGGLVASDTSYITAGLSTDQNGNSSVRNVYITVTNKNDFSEAGTKLIWITNYTEEVESAYYTHMPGTHIMNPYLIKITNKSFMLLWMDAQNRYINYVMLDENGNLVGSIQTINAELSECMPVVSDGKLVWYSYKKDRIIFYTWDIQ